MDRPVDFKQLGYLRRFIIGTTYFPFLTKKSRNQNSMLVEIRPVKVISNIYSF